MADVSIEYKTREAQIAEGLVTEDLVRDVGLLEPLDLLRGQRELHRSQRALVAASLIGISDVAGKYYVPQLGAFLIYLVMLVLLMWRPTGLLGRR